MNAKEQAKRSKPKSNPEAWRGVVSIRLNQAELDKLDVIYKKEKLDSRSETIRWLIHSY